MLSKFIDYYIQRYQVQGRLFEELWTVKYIFLVAE